MSRTRFLAALTVILLTAGWHVQAQYSSMDTSYSSYIYNDGIIGVTQGSWHNWGEDASITMLTDVKNLSLSFNEQTGTSNWSRSPHLSYTITSASGERTRGAADNSETNKNNFTMSLSNLKKGDTLTFDYSSSQMPQYHTYNFAHSQNNNALYFYANAFGGMGGGYSKRFNVIVETTAGQPLPDVLATLLIAGGAAYLLIRQRRKMAHAAA